MYDRSRVPRKEWIFFFLAGDVVFGFTNSVQLCGRSWYCYKAGVLENTFDLPGNSVTAAGNFSQHENHIDTRNSAVKALSY